jgi:hypothetical protein
MKRASSHVAAAFAALAALSLGSAACQLSSEEEPCLNIPDGGCPGVDPTNCLDVTCAAIYTCQPNGTWVEAVACPAREAGVDATADASDATLLMEGAPRDASVDVPGAFGGPGCTDLEDPDCPLGMALGCGPGCCGCSDLYVCQDGGWLLWGECIDGGAEPDPSPGAPDAGSKG